MAENVEDLKDPSEDKEDFEKELPDIIKEEENVEHVRSIDTCPETACNQSATYVIKLITQ